jgi:glycyl-tRNA synthetase beta subunit
MRAAKHCSAKCSYIYKGVSEVQRIRGGRAQVEPVAGAVDAFFDTVFVMCDDAAVRANRLALLREVAALPRGVLDLAQLPGF